MDRTIAYLEGGTRTHQKDLKALGSIAPLRETLWIDVDLRVQTRALSTPVGRVARRSLRGATALSTTPFLMFETLLERVSRRLLFRLST